MKSKTKKNSSIIFIQIICSLLIVNYHTEILNIPFLNYLAQGGFILNSIFVFISGYLLTKSFCSNNKINFKTFIIRRIQRIYPSFIIVIIIDLVYSFFSSEQIIISNYLKTLTGFGYFFNNHEIFSDNHLWFISVIMVCYISFMQTYRFAIKYPYIFIFTISVILLLYNYLLMKNPSTICNNISSDKILRFLYHYLIFCIAIITQTKKYKITTYKILHLIVLCFSFLGYSYYIQKKSVSVISLFFAIIVVLSLIPTLSKIAEITESKHQLLNKLKDITYEIYLIHFIVINIINKYLHGNILGYILTFLISIPLALLINILSIKFTEKLNNKISDKIA